MLAAGQQQGLVRGRSPLTELTSARRALCQLVLYTKKIKPQFQNTKAPTSLEISTRNLREVIGHGQTRVA